MEIEVKKGKIWYYVELIEHCQLYTEEELRETANGFEKMRDYANDMQEMMKNYKPFRVGDYESMELVRFDVFKKNFEKALLVHITEILSTNSNKELNALITNLKWHKKTFESTILELNVILENPFHVYSKVVIKHKMNVLKAINTSIEQKLDILEYTPLQNVTPSVSKSKTKQEIKDLIGGDKLSEAFDELLRISENGDSHNDLIMLKNQFTNYHKSKMIGTLSREDEPMKNRIVNSLLKKIDELYQ